MFWRDKHGAHLTRRHTDRQTKWQGDAGRRIDLKYRYTDQQTDRQIDWQTDAETDKQTDRQTHRRRYK